MNIKNTELPTGQVKADQFGIYTAKASFKFVILATERTNKPTKC
jgi:hypothetical protein